MRITQNLLVMFVGSLVILSILTACDSAPVGPSAAKVRLDLQDLFKRTITA